MLLGCGIDLLNLDRVKRLLNKFPDRLVQRVLSKEEQEILLSSKKDSVNYIGKRFCAKEAFSKAVGCGLGSNLNLQHISVLNNEYGKPYIVLSEPIKRFLAKTFNCNYANINIHVSITDEIPYVNAMVIITKD